MLTTLHSTHKQLLQSTVPDGVTVGPYYHHPFSHMLLSWEWPVTAQLEPASLQSPTVIVPLRILLL